MQKNIYSLMIALFALGSITAFAQGPVSFTNSNAKLTIPNAHSGCAVTVCDWNNDGLDDIIHLDQGHACYVEVQTTNAQYTRVSLGDFGSGNSAWAMTVGDVDHNGYLDVIADGAGQVGLLKTNNTGGDPIVWLANSGFFLQNLTFGDFDNDGWLDLFCCDDNAASHIYMNDGAGNLNTSTFIDFDFYPGQTTLGGDPYDSGNYGSAWIDFDNDNDLDLFIAHCRQAASSQTDVRRRDRLYVNDGANNFTEQAGAYGIETSIYNQTWTVSFGDIDNDGDLDMLCTNHDVSSQILQNDGTGHYTDITASTNFNIDDITPIESVMEDFNNDGWIDIMVTGDDARFFLNNGNGTFTKITTLFNSNNMESFAIGDLNHDGFVDIYASYATIYTNPTNIDDVIWMNDKNSNHFLTLQLRGTVSNHNAVGARATLYSSLGIQIREVRAGESYGTCNSFQCHFGLGAVTTIDSVVIRFPSGITQSIINPSVDQFITVIEGDCVSPPTNLAINGPLVLCPGQTLTLDAPAGYSYTWSNGGNTQSIGITQSGEYNVMVSAAGNNCTAISPNVIVQVNPSNVPTVTASGPVEFCPGGSVDLMGPAGQASYLWSNGSTSQNLTVTQSGMYDLTVPGLCQSFTSTPIAVAIHVPIISSVQNDSACIGASAILTASGTSDIDWYDASTGGNLLHTGATFNTPAIINNTVFYAEDRFGIPLTHLPPVDNTFGSGGNHTNNTRYLIFTVYQPMVLQSVRVFAVNAGNRTIELRDASNNLVQSVTVNIPNGDSHVTIGFTIQPGVDYRLGLSNASASNLFRNDAGANYPYNLSGLVSITGSSAGSGYYYYYYDWEVRQVNPVCTSARVPVTAFSDPNCVVGLAQHASNDLLNVYPNPASNFIQVELKSESRANVEISVNDLAGKTIQTSTNSNDNGSFKQTVDLSNLAKGFYILRVKSGNDNWERKITLQ